MSFYVFYVYVFSSFRSFLPISSAQLKAELQRAALAQRWTLTME